jgi:sterol desaturase/sphingolipid hydroxylase (fatty acid hydroxylase superfamily)
MHILTVYLFGINHIFTIIAFMLIGAYLASINHTRISFKIFSLYSVEDHDIHHNYFKCNYGSYSLFWDIIFKTAKKSKNLID